MAETILGTDGTRDIGISLADRRQGVYIIGSNGTGKSILIENMVVQDIEHGIGVCVLDPHGDLTKAIINRIPEERVKDTILLNPLDQKAFGLNVYSCADPTNSELVDDTVNQVMQIYEKIYGVDRENPLTIQVLRHTAITILENGLTMAEIPALIFDDAFRARLIRNVTNPQTKYFWQMYERLRPDEKMMWSGTAFRRVDEFLSTLFLRTIVGQLQSTINFREIMDTRKILLCRLPGKLKAATSLLGATIIGQIYLAALSRENIPERKRKPFGLYADEFQRFATPAMADMLAEGRKYGILTTLAHQFRDQLDDANKGATLQARTKIVFGVGSEDAKVLAPEFNTMPGEIEKTIPGDILRYLPHHKSDVVKGFWGQYVKFWEEAKGKDERERIQTYSDIGVLGSVSWEETTTRLPRADLGWGVVSYDPIRLRDAVASLESYLTQIMEEKPETTIIKENIAGFDFETERLPFNRPPILRRFLTLISPYLGFETYLRVQLETLDYIYQHTSITPLELDEWCKKMFSQKTRETVAFEAFSCNFFLSNLTATVKALHENPIMIEVAGSTRQNRADKTLEIESDLVHLPTGKAWVKTPHGEWKITTILPEELDSGFVRKSDSIRQNTREKYCRDRKEVEAEIAARIKPDPPPTQRRGAI